MAQLSGTDIAVGLYQETVFGADPDPADGRLCYFSSFGIAATQNEVEDPVMRAGRGSSRPVKGNVAVSGAVATTLSPQSAGFWLRQILGHVTSTGEAAPYTHVFKPGALPVGFVAEKDYTSKLASKVERFNGLRVSSADFGFVQEGPVTLSVNCEGKRYSIGTAPLDATLSDPGHRAWAGFNGVVKREGTVIGGVRGATLKIENNLATDIYCFPAASETPGQRFSLPEGQAKISGSIDLVFQDFTLIDLAAADTATAFEWTYTFGTGAGTAGNEQITFALNYCSLPLNSPAIETPSGMQVSVPFTAFQDGADLGLIVTLKNAISGAAL
jgi:hypothetical protein